MKVLYFLLFSSVDAEPVTVVAAVFLAEGSGGLKQPPGSPHLRLIQALDAFYVRLRNYQEMHLRHRIDIPERNGVFVLVNDIAFDFTGNNRTK